MNLENKEMEPVIQIINSLQDISSQISGFQFNLNLPQIAVVGSQSAGKSSVLENIAGRDFLPRGIGIVTRRPLVLQLFNSNMEYGEFLHKKNEKFTDFNAILREIETETNRVAGSNLNISSTPINLRIYSPHVCDLTLVDLPGLTKVPIGDQPEDIEKQIRDMVLDYLKKENCLILAVTAANQDLATSDALKLAREVDPDGIRTIGVLTKLDLMDEGTDASDILENRVFPLKRGYIGVVNRSQIEIDNRQDIQEALAKESNFFSNHRAYKHLSHKMGTEYLKKFLSQQLINHIRDTLPKLLYKLQEKKMQLEKEVNLYKKSTDNNSASEQKTLIKLIYQLKNDLESSIDGRTTNNININELNGGARIYRIFNEHLPKEIKKSMKYDEKKLKKEIEFAIGNIYGIQAGIFTPDKAFETLVCNYIKGLETPSLECVELVINELLDVINKCTEKIKKYPKLRNKVQRLMQTKIREDEQKTKDEIKLLVDVEISYLNPKNKDFIEFATAQSNVEMASIPNLVNQLIRKGYLHMKGKQNIMNDTKVYWFVLTSNDLSWFKDEKEEDKRYMLPLDELMMSEIKSDFISKKHSFALSNINNKNVYRNLKQLKLSCETEEDMKDWMASFATVGVYCEKERVTNIDELPDFDHTNDDELQESDHKNVDPNLERKIETIYKLVEAYVKTVDKTVEDLVPKYITKLLVNSMKDFIDETLNSLLNDLHGTQSTLMKMSAEEEKRKEDVLKLYDAIVDASKSIEDFVI